MTPSALRNDGKAVLYDMSKPILEVKDLSYQAPEGKIFRVEDRKILPE